MIVMIMMMKIFFIYNYMLVVVALVKFHELLIHLASQMKKEVRLMMVR